MKKLGLSCILLSVGVASFLAAGCGDEFDSCESNENCASGTGGTDGGTGATGGTGGTGNTSGTGATGGTGGDGGGCDTSKSPSEQACLVDDQYAIFVSPSGNDGAAGTKTAPVKSIAKGMELAKGGLGRVIACNDTFDTALTVGSAHDGVKVYGGFNCSSWAYESTKKTPVTPTAKGYALSIDGTTTGVTFEDFTFTAKEGTAEGESSIAAFVKNAQKVAFSRVDFKAGVGVNGKSGVLAPVPLETDALKLDGNAASGDSGGGLKECTCQAGGKSVGGAGGSKNQAGGDGEPTLAGGKGGTVGTCSPDGAGKDGTAATAQPPAAGAKTVGKLDANGFSGEPGANGTNGTPGQGGGGGAGAPSTSSGGGGGGGCGGCGGAGGPGGGAGGSSIALLVFASGVTAQDCKFTALDAGNGGSGAAGQTGATKVGFGGNKTSGGCQGGNGGLGGDGGDGGGGAGGLSVGILSDNTATVTDTGSSFAKGKAGLAGAGGDTSNAGVAGDSQDKLKL